ncbi:protein kinase domain protein [Stylonychia lemnae]|uniref:Protein kinase domain protein n=1 Tax=Stylonychia lemnae TaxID=5949 RepID=A0A078AGV8_STYLE|nr:protein kinase domain protein [Stylonychia lemnae]|eukprot:CDW81454.1 protein kinase domain protein [Stylonychia lemnae]
MERTGLEQNPELQEEEIFNDEQKAMEPINFEASKQDILKLFYEDEPIQAYNLFKKLKQCIEQDLVQFNDDQSETPEQQMDKFEQSEEMVALKKDFLIIEYFMKELNSDMSSWTRHTDKPDFKIYYRQEQGFKGLTLYLEVEFKSPLMNLFTILAEVDLFQKWIPFTAKSELKGSVSHLRKLAYLKQNFPFPMSAREVYLSACGIALEDQKACILTLSSVEKDSWFGTSIQRDPKCVYMDIHKAFIYAKALDKNTSVLKMIQNVDPHLDYIPQALINFGMKNLIGVFIGQIRKRCENLPEEYLKLMEEKKEFYDEIYRKVCAVSQESVL